MKPDERHINVAMQFQTLFSETRYYDNLWSISKQVFLTSDNRDMSQFLFDTIKNKGNSNNNNKLFIIIGRDRRMTIH